jgi:hypothetical protein
VAYATLADLQARTTDRAASEGLLQGALDAAEGAVNRYCGRTFDLAGSASARVFEVTREDRVNVDDIGSTTDLAIATGRPGSFTTTLAADTQYWLKPLNAITLGRPYEYVWTESLFTVAPYPTVQVTARWGWPSVPAEVGEATLLLAQRLVARKDSPTGVAGFGDYGVVRITAADADVARLLDPYAKPSGGW